MNLIVCGDAFWISCGTWLAFWGGVIGALVAALLSAAVAFLVVKWTNAQARHGVERTIEVAAIGDCVAAMEGLDWAMRRYAGSTPFDAGTFMLPMRAAVARLQMSRQESIPLAEILIHWPEMLVQVALDYKNAVDNGDPDAEGTRLLVTEVSTMATTALPWCTSNHMRRNESMALVLEADGNLRSAYMPN